MIYREFQPGAVARRFVKCYWYLEDDRPGPAGQRIVPDGRSELILNFGEPFEHCSEGRWRLQPRFFLVGQITRPLVARPSGATRTIGVRFHPDGASRLLPLPMHELTDRTIPIDEVAPPLARRFEELGELPFGYKVYIKGGNHDSAVNRTGVEAVDPGAAAQARVPVPREIAALDNLFARLCARFEEDRMVAHAVGRFEATSGRARIADVARELGFSVRQMERRFVDAVGISPKLFCRMQRFERMFSRMQCQDARWVELAISCGYYDQAHLIRDFREFTGTTPTALLAAEVDLARRFLGGRR